MFEPKVHSYSTPFAGNTEAAFDLARTALVSQGFEILIETATEMRARGPGMHSNQQPAIMGVTDFLIRVAGSRIAVTATLGGVATMKAFVVLFPPGLMLSLMFLPWFMGEPATWWGFFMVVPWMLVSPRIARSLERKTERAVDGMVRGMVQVGNRK
jgi:hypothetical protein